MDDFWNTIKNRRLLSEGTARDELDENIWQGYGREVAIMFTDLSGFTKLSNRYGIEEFLCVIQASHELFDPIIDEAGGQSIMKKGDSYLIIFDTIEIAVDCAIAMQKSASAFNKTVENHRQVNLCLGLGVGRSLVINGRDIYGAEVNLASKLGEDVAENGEILLTAKARVKLESSRFQPYLQAYLDRDILGEVYKLNWTEL
jgi:adenylate cyclase